LTETNRQIRLAARPQGEVQPTDWELTEEPAGEPADGQFAGRTLAISLDPAMRGWMDDRPSYLPPVGLGEVMRANSVIEVTASNHPRYPAGDHVVGVFGAQTHVVSDGRGATRADLSLAPASTYLGALGMPGLTAYAGLHAIARPKQGETVVVGAASGAVGAIAGQLARLAGCRVVGVAGGAEKCRYVEGELGFDRCLDRREPDLAGRLEQACPDGIDVYVELVGGDLLWAALPLMNVHGRIPVIGSIAWYNLKGLPDGPDRSPLLARAVLTKRLRVEGLIVFDHAHLEPEFRREVAPLVRAGRLKYREDVVEGLARAPEALVGLLRGRNFGKLLVAVSPDPTRQPS
jgi:NADPH-dependent curcumin reductase CurA